MSMTTGCSIRVRCEDSKVEEIRRRALKLGATSISSRVVVQNQVESVAVFKKAAAARDFKNWVISKCKVDICE